MSSVRLSDIILKNIQKKLKILQQNRRSEYSDSSSVEWRQTDNKICFFVTTGEARSVQTEIDLFVVVVI